MKSEYKDTRTIKFKDNYKYNTHIIYVGVKQRPNNPFQTWQYILENSLKTWQTVSAYWRRYFCVKILQISRMACQHRDLYC